MSDRELVRVATRSSAAFFLAYTLGSLLITFFPEVMAPGVDMMTVRLVSLAGLPMAGLILVLPWDRWPPRATMAIPLVSVPFFALGNYVTRYAASDMAVGTVDLVFVVIQSWIGLTQRRGFAIAFAPYIGIVFGGSLVLTPGSQISTFSLVGVLLATTLIAEIIAWVMERYRGLRLVGQRRVTSMRLLSSALADVRARTDRTQLSGAVEGLACRLLHSPSATVILADGGPGADRTDGSVELDHLPGDHGVAHSTAHGSGASIDGRFVTIPIGTSRSRRGVVELERVDAERMGGEDFADLVSRLFSSEVGNAVDQVGELESLGRQARIDELTEIGNRRHAADLLAALEPGDAVVLVDVDKFKEVNDSDGHPAGDRLLRGIAAHLRLSVRDADTVARFGGDEFLVVLRAVESNEEARETVERRLHHRHPPR